MGDKPSLWSELYGSAKVRAAAKVLAVAVAGVIAGHYGLGAWVASFLGQ